MTDNIKANSNTDLGSFGSQFSAIWVMPCQRTASLHLQAQKPLDIIDFFDNQRLGGIQNIEITLNIEQMAEGPIFGLMSNLQDEISNWNPHQQLVTRIRLEKIGEIGIHGSNSSLSMGIVELNLVKAKGRLIESSNTNNLVGVAGKGRLMAENSTSRGFSEFEYVIGEAGDASSKRKRYVVLGSIVPATVLGMIRGIVLL